MEQSVISLFSPEFASEIEALIEDLGLTLK